MMGIKINTRHNNNNTWDSCVARARLPGLIKMASSSSSSSEDEEERKIMAEIADCAAKGTARNVSIFVFYLFIYSFLIDLSQALARKVDTENKNNVVSKR